MARNRTSGQPEILVPLTRDGQGPMHAQIERAIREAVRTGRLAPGAPVPSTRALAHDLGVSRGVVVEAYEQLHAEGYLATRPGFQTVIASRVALRAPEAPEPKVAAAPFDFRPGLPDLTWFPREEWARAARAALRYLQPRQLGYGDPRGASELRAALAAYLGRVRGVVASERRLVVCSGFAQGLAVAARALARNGVRRLAMEDPGSPDPRRIVADAGLTPVGVRVDGEGVVVAELERVEALLVTPAHQFPTGAVLSPERRHQLLAWAERRSAFVIEDDYDAEYRYDRSPVGALQGLAPERVLYAGSASKILAPALRLGWLALPAALLDAATEAKALADLGTPFLEQLAFAEFLASGALDRHLRRMRALYGRRRAALLQALARVRPRWTPEGAAAGLHLTALLPNGEGEEEVAAHALERGVRLYPMRDYGFSAASRHPPALVLGYACLTERQIATAVGRLKR